ncbi:MAG: PEP/pyruvate-binding domain-containing protein [Acidobacteriota bacterium]
MTLPSFLRNLLAGRSDGGSEDARGRFLRKYEAYRKLASANNAALEVLADLQSKAGGEFLFDAKYLRDATANALARGREVVEALDALSGGRERRLRGALAELETKLAEETAPTVRIPDGPRVLSLSEAADAPVDLVGAKAWRLAVLRTRAGVPAPDGFSITSRACRDFLEQGGIFPKVRAAVEDLPLANQEGLLRTSEALRAAVLGTPWPRDLADKILSAFDALEARTGKRGLLVSARSSAVGEDGDFSFAGQYASILNVDREHILEACREVLASQFGPRALVYYKARGAGGDLLPMAVCVVAMVDARASGVLYTRPPDDPSEESMVLAGSWGLGPSTVDGRLTPDVFTVGRGAGHPLLRSRVAPKDRMLLCRESRGLVDVEVPGWMRDQPCLTPAQVSALAGFGAALEAYFGRAQDVEWALDAEERIVILQSRPLRVSGEAAGRAEVLAQRKGLTPLLSEGTVVSRGVGSGPVFLLEDGDSPTSVPPGAVLVARAAEPRLAEAMDRAAALVTEVGSTTSHLATVAREFGVPALFGVRGALASLNAGTVVTVDAELGNVYPGRVDALLESAARRRAEGTQDTPLFRRLRAILALLTPLNLTDVRGRNFKAAGCQTLHDILRYAHERAMEEMFLAGGSFGKESGGALRLASPLPVSFYFLDLGGGLEMPAGERELRPEHFRCRPLLHLWPGMIEVPWDKAPAASGRDVASLMMTAMTSGDVARQMAEPNYVLVSDVYLNMNFRLGYHFSRVDACSTDNVHENYASLLFHGGAADLRGRSRRVDFIERVLRRDGWRSSRRGDALFARIENQDAESLAHRLRALGRLLVVTRQVDTLFGSDSDVERAAEAFAKGDFTLGLGEAPP